MKKEEVKKKTTTTTKASRPFSERHQTLSFAYFDNRYEPHHLTRSVSRKPLPPLSILSLSLDTRRASDSSGSAMAMQAGMGLSRILILVGAGNVLFPIQSYLYTLCISCELLWSESIHCVGYTGTIMLKNGKLSDLLGEIQVIFFFLGLKLC